VPIKNIVSAEAQQNVAYETIECRDTEQSALIECEEERNIINETGKI